MFTTPHNVFLSGVAELTWLHTALPYRTNVAKCSLLKFIRSYLNSWCRNVSQRWITMSCGDGTRWCSLLLTLMRVPGGTLISVMRCVQILVFLRTLSTFDFGTICWRKLRQALCVIFSSYSCREIQWVYKISKKIKISGTFVFSEQHVWLVFSYLPLQNGWQGLLQHKLPTERILTMGEQTQSGLRSVLRTHTDQSEGAKSKVSAVCSIHTYLFSFLLISIFNVLSLLTFSSWKCQFWGIWLFPIAASLYFYSTPTQRKYSTFYSSAFTW